MGGGMRQFYLLIGLVAALLAGACGGAGGGSGGSSGSSSLESGDCVGGGWCGEKSISVQSNIGGAEALFIAQSSQSVLSSESATQKAVTVSTASPLFAVTTEGIVGVLAAKHADGSSALSELPRLSFVAVSPAGHVVLVFEHPFIYRDTADGVKIETYKDPWSPSSPFTCQIFVVEKKIQSTASGESPGMTCITNSLELNTWDFRSAMIQFDKNGGVYFSAHVPQNWKDVLLKWTPGTDDPATSADESTSGTLAEVINANICFREFLVTNDGGVLYTGITSTSGDCNGTSFLRYKTPAGVLQEITSGWWDYVFAPIESSLFTSANLSVPKAITSSNVGEILFYGPDPETATSPDWDDACLFKFDPDQSGNARSVKITDCQTDFWRYVDWADTIATQKTRCTETKNVMGGGNIPQKILLADFSGDTKAFETYVIGNVFEKKSGEWRCDLCVDEAHCTRNSRPNRTWTTQATCEANSGTWVSSNKCYNQITKDTALSYDVCTVDNTSWKINGQWCEQPGGSWSDTYSAFALVNFDDKGTTDESDDATSLVRLSATNEIVRSGWVIKNRLVYASFNSDDGVYKLRELKWTPSGGSDTTIDQSEVTQKDLLSGIEVYELFADPRSDKKGLWFFNGLRFSDNQYITGTFNPDPTSGTAADTLATESGVTGQIETLVIVPEL